MAKRKYGDAATYARIRELRKPVAVLRRQGLLSPTISARTIEVAKNKAGDYELKSRAVKRAVADYQDVVRGDSRAKKISKADFAKLQETHGIDAGLRRRNGRVIVSKQETVLYHKSDDGQESLSIGPLGVSARRMIMLDDPNYEEKIKKNWIEGSGFRIMDTNSISLRTFVNAEDLITYLQEYLSVKKGEIKYVVILTPTQVAKARGKAASDKARLKAEQRRSGVYGPKSRKEIQAFDRARERQMDKERKQQKRANETPAQKAARNERNKLRMRKKRDK